MNKSFIFVAMMLVAGTAMATPDKTNQNCGSNGKHVGNANCGGAGGAGGAGAVAGAVGVGIGVGGNATGGNATVGNVTGISGGTFGGAGGQGGSVNVGGIGNSSLGGKSFSPSSEASVTNFVAPVANGGSAKQGQLQGQQQGQAIVGSGNSNVSTKGTVGNVSGGSVSVSEGAVQSANTNTANGGAGGNATGGSVASGAVVVNVQQPQEQQTREITGTTTQNINYSVSGTTTVKNVPDVGAPALSSSNDTCMGSTSIGGSGVGFGISLGTTWTDENCLMLKNSRELWNMGMKSAALARMCMDKKNREALELTGFVCPQAKKAQDEAAK